MCACRFQKPDMRQSPAAAVLHSSVSETELEPRLSLRPWRTEMFLLRTKARDSASHPASESHADVLPSDGPAESADLRFPYSRRSSSRARKAPRDPPFQLVLAARCDTPEQSRNGGGHRR